MRSGAVLVFAAAAVPLLLLVSAASADDDSGCTADGTAAQGDRAQAKALKIAAFISILVCGALGCCQPVLCSRVKALRADGDIFFLVKAFAAGVILATGFIHVLPDAFEKLTSDCLPADGPWQNFPFAGFGAMVGAMGTLIVDTVATAYFKRANNSKNSAEASVAASAAVVGDDEEMQQAAVASAVHDGAAGSDDQMHVHTHAAHGSSALVAAVGGDKEHALRHRVIAQVLELGIVVHSIIIGVSLGASQDPTTIKPLVVALSFHQMFEGMGLGGCIAQAKFKVSSIVSMVVFFCLTTPVGILVGIGISSVYNEDSPMALMIEGTLNSLGAGILLYMSLVDLLAEDIGNPKVQRNVKLQLGIYLSMFLGAGLMSLLAKWA